MDSNPINQISTFESRNVYADVFIPLLRRPSKKENMTSVICVQQIGVSTTDSDEIQKIKQLMDTLKNRSVESILLHDKLKFAPSNDLIQQVKDGFKNYDDTSKSLKSIINHLFAQSSIFSSLEKDTLALFNTGMYNVIELFKANESFVNTSKLVNITTKLLYWIEAYIIESIASIQSTPTKEYINPKLLYFGKLSHQESYFLLFVLYLKFDVLYFNFEDDDTSHWIQPLQTVTQKKKHNGFGNNASWTKFFVTTQQVAKEKQNPPKQVNKTSSAPSKPVHKSPEKKTLTKKHIQAKGQITNKKFDGKLTSIASSLKSRPHFVDMPSPILPVYFVRYVGTDNDYNEYRNRLYHFNKHFKTTNKSYIAFDGTINVGNYASLTGSTQDIWQQYKNLSPKQIEELVAYLAGVDIYSFIDNDILQSLCYSALEKVLKVFFASLNEVPVTKIKNLVIKLIGWLKEHSLLLFSGYSFNKEYNPLVLYNGDIKNHEALYLIFLSQIGVDVLYVNSFQDTVFESLDSQMKYSEVFTLDTVHPQERLPKSEVMIQQQTIASQASEDIAQVIHNVQDGVYLPWQFEKYTPMPLTLKTTYDEILILWNEEARIRTGFKVVNETIYIPNLFIKISATHDDLNEYWKTIQLMSSSKLTSFHSALPFTNVHFNEGQTSSLKGIFDHNGMPVIDKLKSHGLYKYTHLSSEIQNQIYKKLCILLDTDIINNSQEIRNDIVYTILHLDKHFLELIQNFDYPASIPKLVIYDPDETIFSKSDFITLAFLYVFGFDICVLTPTGYSNFEPFIDEKYYNVFKLPNKRFKLSLPDLNRYSNSKSKSFWSGIFK